MDAALLSLPYSVLQLSPMSLDLWSETEGLSWGSRHRVFWLSFCFLFLNFILISFPKRKQSQTEPSLESVIPETGANALGNGAPYMDLGKLSMNNSNLGFLNYCLLFRTPKPLPIPNHSHHYHPNLTFLLSHSLSRYFCCRYYQRKRATKVALRYLAPSTTKSRDCV